MKKVLSVIILSAAVMLAMCFSLYAETAQYYVSGDFNGYTNPDENYKMASVGNGTYSVTSLLQAGDHIYKVTNGTWDAAGCWGKDSYAHPNPPVVDTGAFGNILFKTDKEQNITFYFNENTKKVADSTFYTLLEPYVVSDFFNEIGIGDDWDAAKATTLLTDPEFDNIYTGTFKIPAGKYTFKVTMGKSWETSYGIDGATTGMDTGIPLELSAESEVTFTFDAKTHITTLACDGLVKAPAVVKEAPAAEENPKTGDAGLVLPILGLLAGAAGIRFSRKK